MNHTFESRPRLLLVDDDKEFRALTGALLHEVGYHVEGVNSGAAALDALRLARESGTGFDAVLLDLRMPGVDGLEVVETLRLDGDGVPVLMISGAGTVELAVQALHLGADDFLLKPFRQEELTSRLADVLGRRPINGKQPGDNPAGMVGRSPRMVEVMAALRSAATGHSSVLIRGENGTGKELTARAIHAMSPRSDKPFIAVDCTHFGEAALERELFGYVSRQRSDSGREVPGLFEAAHGGTLFLNGLESVPLRSQRRLMRALKPGFAGPDVRVVAGTSADLRQRIAAGTFREDLFDQLAVLSLDLPPLRERAGDVPLLAVHALAVAAVASGITDRGVLAFSPFAMRLLRDYAWPGNVRQLFAVVDAAALQARFARIEAQHLPLEIRATSARAMRTGSDRGEPSRYQGSEVVERAAIVSALAEAGGVRRRAADLLGMGRTTLWRKLKAHGIAQ